MLQKIRERGGQVRGRRWPELHAVTAAALPGWCARAVQAAQIPCNDNTITEMIQAIDINGDGVIR